MGPYSRTPQESNLVRTTLCAAGEALSVFLVLKTVEPKKVVTTLKITNKNLVAVSAKAAFVAIGSGVQDVPFEAGKKLIQEVTCDKLVENMPDSVQKNELLKTASSIGCQYALGLLIDTATQMAQKNEQS